MTSYIKKFTLQRLESYDWMDGQTKQIAKYKVHRGSNGNWTFQMSSTIRSVMILISCLQ